MSNRRFIFGEWQDASVNLTAADALEICAAANQKREVFSRVPLDKIYSTLQAVAEKWSNPSYEHRMKMQELLPNLTGFSPEMVKLGLDELPHLLSPKILDKKVRTELRGIPRSPDFKYESETNRMLRWHPIGSILHILSGNVFLVGPGSLLEGLLTGNITILKMPSQEKTFMPVFMESVLEVESELGDGPTISQSVALIDFSSSSKDVIQVFKDQMDGIIVWGGEEAVKAYRNDLPARSRMIVFGPKLSIAMVTKAGLTDPSDCARKLADELAIWDQNACTAPQVCFVESIETAERLVEAMPAAMEARQKELPAGPLDANQAAEIRKIRSVEEIASVRTGNVLKESSHGLDWTVVLDHNLDLSPSPLHRTIRIVPYRDIREVTDQIAQLRAYVQTVGLQASPSEHISLAKELGEMGVLRVLPLGQMLGGEIDDPHDGAYDLPQLLNLVPVKLPEDSRRSRIVDQLDSQDKQAIVDAKLRIMIAEARNHPFYQDRLKNVKIDSTKDLEKLSITTKADVKGNLIPEPELVNSGGYITRTGGSTGEPCFAYTDHTEWQAMVANAADVFRVSGFNASDRIANCMSAGDLYGSFISFDAVIHHLGMTVFPFAGAATAESLVENWRKFKFNAIVGIPSMILPILRKAKQIEPNFYLEKFMYAGVPMSQADKDWAKQELGVQNLCSIIGTSEANQLAYQTDECKGNVHKLIDDYNYIEIVDDAGNSVKDGEMGNILVTSLTKFRFPIIRFAIGDRARIVTLEGHDGRYIEYAGRADDVLAIGLLNLRYRDFEAALAEFKPSAVQLVGRYGDQREQVVVNIESSEEVCSNQVLEKLRERITELGQFIDKGYVEIKVKVHQPGELPRNERTGKLKLLIDERY